MNITLQTKLTLEIKDGTYTLIASRGGKRFDSIQTKDMEALMVFAEYHNWGTFESREFFETYVMLLKENPAYVFDVDLHKN